VDGEKVRALTCIHQRNCAQLVSSPRQHPDITAGVTNGCDTLVPFLTAFSLCLCALPGCDIPWNTVGICASVVNIYFRSLTHIILEMWAFQWQYHISLPLSLSLLLPQSEVTVCEYLDSDYRGIMGWPSRIIRVDSHKSKLMCKQEAWELYVGSAVGSTKCHDYSH